ncbi:MAG: hypothetical protein ABH846_01535 [Patescibacteria group bacterium]
MIDTVCLTLPYGSLVLLDENNKAVPQWNLQSKTENYSKYVRNPSKADKSSGLYFPRLTIYSRRRGQQPSVKIEFSVPKLIFNNNLEELTDKHFEQVIDALQDRIQKMGIRVFKQVLASAPITTVHFSKNFSLSDGYTSSYIISELQKIDLRKSFDFAQKRFINNGQSLQAHTRAHELVIYDKIADLSKTKKRAIDKDQTVNQLSLFDFLNSKDTLVEILRIEVRLCNKQKINSIFKKLKLSQNPTFREVFSSKTSKTVVGHYWESVIKSDQLALFTIDQPAKELLREMCRGDPTLKPKQAIYQVGLVLLAKDGDGLTELRSIFENRTNDRNWYRIKDDFKQMSANASSQHIRGWVNQIEKQIRVYSPLKITK